MNTSSTLKSFLEEIIQNNPSIADKKTKAYFLKRAKEGKISIDENPISHFCAYFIAYDPHEKKVFLGHHIKSGLWLFNGGHMDKGELPFNTIKREVQEEWGIPVDLSSVKKPLLLSITDIKSNPVGRLCREHIEFCFFIPVDSHTFYPVKEKLDIEFYTTAWITIHEAKKLISDPTTLKCLIFIESFS